MPSDQDSIIITQKDKKIRKDSKSEKWKLPQPKPELSISPKINTLRTSFDFSQNGKQCRIVADDLITICELGRGAYGVVEKVNHPETNTTMAVKRIVATQDSLETKQLLMDLETLERSDCPYIVRFYGKMFRQGDVMICMEVMDMSLDNCYRRVAKANKLIPEDVLWAISFSVLSALTYLNKVLRVIHRDVKPSNMLIDRNGNVKLCDFGISGILRVAKSGSLFAQTVIAGCKYYMAPERIDPPTQAHYSTKSDTWSFGISMIEISTGTFPYETTTDLFRQQMQILNEDAPSLPDNGTFSPAYKEFLRRALEKNVNVRPRPHELLEDPFLREQRNGKTAVSSFFNDVLDNILDE